MVVDNGEENDPIEAQMTPEVDDIVGSKTKSDKIGGADGIDGKKEKYNKKIK